jgi:hypothetical protein
MASRDSFEKMSSSIGSLSKSEVKKRLIDFKSKLNLEFTETYLDALSIDKLRHILFAAMVTVSKKSS